MVSFRRAALVPVAVLLLQVLPVPAGGGSVGLLPDIQTIVPKHVQLVNAHQREIIRFSNGIVNTGVGHWRMRPEVVGSGSGAVQTAVQEILDASGNVVAEHVVSEFEFHPEHNHWHIADVAHFSIHKDGPTGEIVGGNSVKITFCLIDWYKLDDNGPTPERSYFQCGADRQGISPGWVDQYRHSVPDQDLDVTGIAPGEYYLVSHSNPTESFIETDYTNNTAWVTFRITRASKGNASLTITGHSPCGNSPGMCGQQKTNR